MRTTSPSALCATLNDRHCALLLPPPPPLHTHTQMLAIKVDASNLPRTYTKVGNLGGCGCMCATHQAVCVPVIKPHSVWQHASLPFNWSVADCRSCMLPLTRLYECHSLWQHINLPSTQHAGGVHPLL